MSEFILDEQLHKVVDKNTKKYLEEVISDYYNGNYRSAVVVLYTIVVYDVMQKLVTLREVYNDEKASNIIDYVRRQQKDNPKNSEWEMAIIDKVYNELHLFTAVEKAELEHLKSERNYAAHPIISINDTVSELKLKTITKETAIDLIRKAFEIVFLKDAILSKNIVNEFFTDLNEYYSKVGNDGLENYLSKKYFHRMDQVSQEYLFKALWKNVFILDETVHRDNRISNYLGLKSLYSLNKEVFKKLIKSSEDIFFNRINIETIDSFNSEVIEEDDIISYLLYESDSRIMNLIKFIQEHPEIYSILNDYAKGQIENSINNMYVKNGLSRRDNYRNQCQSRLEITTMYFKDSESNKFEYANKIISNYYQNSKYKTYNILYKEDIEIIYRQSKYFGLDSEFIEFIIGYATAAKSFSEADSLFKIIQTYLCYCNEYDFYSILFNINKNSQFYNNCFIKDYIKILDKAYKDMFNKELFFSNGIKFLNNNVYKKYDNTTFISVDYIEVLQLLNKYIKFYDEATMRAVLIDCIHNLDENSKIEADSINNIIAYKYNDRCNEYTLDNIEKLIKFVK